jgi:hypothetical protein
MRDERGTVARSGISGMLIGNTAERILRNLAVFSAGREAGGIREPCAPRRSMRSVDSGREDPGSRWYRAAMTNLKHLDDGD